MSARLAYDFIRRARTARVSAVTQTVVVLTQLPLLVWITVRALDGLPMQWIVVGVVTASIVTYGISAHRSQVAAEIWANAAREEWEQR